MDMGHWRIPHHYYTTSDHTAMIDCHDHITHSFLEQCMAIWWPTEETGMVCKSMDEWMECYTSPIILHPIETFNHPIIVLIYGQIDCEIIELLAEIFGRYALGLVRVWFGQTMSIIMEYCTGLLQCFHLHSNFFPFWRCDTKALKQKISVFSCAQFNIPQPFKLIIKLKCLRLLLIMSSSRHLGITPQRSN